MSGFHGFPILLWFALARAVFSPNSLKVTDADQLRSAAAAAMKNLMTHYKPNSEGVFDQSETPWHESGMIWGMHFDYATWAGDHQFLDVVTGALVNVSHTGHSFLAKKGASSEETIKGHWNDDILWQSLAAVSAADFFGPKAALPGAGADADWISLAEVTYDQAGSQADDKCGGGIYWYRDRDDSKGDYKSLITQVEFIAQGARNYLHTGNASALQKSEQILGWIFSSGLGNSENGVLLDGMSVKELKNSSTSSVPHQANYWVHWHGCTEPPDNKNIWVTIASLLRLSLSLHNFLSSRSLPDSHLFAGNEDLSVPFLHQAISTFAGPGTSGVIAELCEANDSCQRDQKGFKAVFVRNLAYLYRETNDAAVKETIRSVIDTSLEAMMGRSCDDNWTCSGYWARGVLPKRYIRSQHVSAALLVAVLGIHTHSPDNTTTGQPSERSTSRGSAEQSSRMKAAHTSSTAKSVGHLQTKQALRKPAKAL